MIRIQLSPAGAARLEALFRATADRKLRDRLQIVLMAHRGRVRQDIAADLGVHRKTVTRWLNAYCDGGPGGLQPKKAPGKPGKIPAALADEVRRWVIDGPAKQGLDRASRSRRPCGTTRTWSSSGFRVTARSSTPSSGSGRSCDVGRRTTGCSTRWRT